jgi:hypothetical protein
MDTNTLMYMLSTSFSLAEVNGFKLPVSRDMINNEKSYKEYIQKRREEYYMDNIDFLSSIGTPTVRHLISNIFYRDDGSSLFVYFHNKSDNNKNIIASIQNGGFTYSIIVSELPFHTSASKNFEEINIRDSVHDKDVFTVITYTDEEFIDLTVSPFKTEIMKIYRGGKDFPADVDTRNMPNILHQDPLAKFYLGKPGDIFLIKRQTGYRNSLLDEELVYRRVIKQTSTMKK